MFFNVDGNDLSVCCTYLVMSLLFAGVITKRYCDNEAVLSHGEGGYAMVRCSEFGFGTGPIVRV